MSDLSINYLGNVVPIGAEAATPLQAAHAIINGYIPGNLLRISNGSDSFRDATIADLVTVSINEGKQEQTLQTLASCLSGSTDGSVQLRIYTEYFAAYAYAMEQHDIAVKAITRNKPEMVTPFIWSIVASMKKQMPSQHFQDLLVSVGGTALNTWNEEAIIYGLQPAVLNPTQTI